MIYLYYLPDLKIIPNSINYPIFFYYGGSIRLDVTQIITIDNVSKNVSSSKMFNFFEDNVLVHD